MKWIKAFLVDVFRVPYLLILGLVTFLGAFGFLSSNKLIGALTITSFFLLALLGRLFQLGARYYRNSTGSLKIRSTSLLTEYDGDKVMLVLERTPLIEIGQILTLEIYHGEIPAQIAYIRVNRYTSTGYPVAVLMEENPRGDMRTTVLDETKIRSLNANPRIILRGRS